MIIRNIKPVFNYSISRMSNYENQNIDNLLQGKKSPNISRPLKNGKGKRAENDYLGNWSVDEIGIDKGLDVTPKNYNVSESGNSENAIKDRSIHIKYFLGYCLSNNLDFISDLSGSIEAYNSACGYVECENTLENILSIELAQ